MQFLKTLFWVLVAVVLAIFAVYNVNTWVDVALPSNLTVNILLPLLVIGAFLVGVLLVWLPHRASVWSWRRKVDVTERKLLDEREGRIRAEEALTHERAAPERVVTRSEPVFEDRPILDADGRVVGHERDTTRG